MEKKVFYVGNFGDMNSAPSIRVKNVSEIFRTLGYTTTFFSTLPGKNQFHIEQFVFFEQEYKRKISKMREVIFRTDFCEMLKKNCVAEKPQIIIFYNCSYYLVKKMEKFCEEKNIKIITDATEWYEIHPFKKSLVSNIIAWSVNKRITKLDTSINNIIAVSPYLFDFYTKKKCTTVLIPPVFSKPMERNPVILEEIVNIIYAGAPGKKDKLDLFLKCVIDMNLKKHKFNVHLFGIDKDFLTKQYHLDVSEKMGIFTYGRTDRTTVLKKLAECDFSILFRENKVYAKAGFSTKFSESLLYGTPVLCNKVGGGENFLTNYKNGIIINDLSKEELNNALEEITAFSIDKRNAMKVFAAELGKTLFLKEAYEEKLADFISEIERKS